MIFDTYSPYHGKINLEKIVPKSIPLFKDDVKRKKGIQTVQAHERAQKMQVYNLVDQKYDVKYRPIPDEYKSILEVSCRAPECPYPLNFDVWEATVCFGCIYCYAIYSKSSLYTSWFDDFHWQQRHISEENLIKRLDEAFVKVRKCEREKCKTGKCGSTGDIKTVRKAISQRIPMHLGVNSDDFISQEKNIGIALAALKYLRDRDYPVYITTKSDMLIDPAYSAILKEISEHNNIAVQVSIIHNNDQKSKLLEPGAPVSSKRWNMIGKLNEQGICANPRLEPLMAFINADDDHLKDYAEFAHSNGARYCTLDTYSYFIKSPMIADAFYDKGFDFHRMWYGTSEYQILGSYILEKAMYYLKQHGIKCGTFNFHSIPYCDTNVCCNFDDLYKDAGLNRYNLWSMTKEIVKRGKMSFKQFDEENMGYELSPAILNRVQKVWNKEISDPWNPEWCDGVYVSGVDSDGNLEYSFDKQLHYQAFNNLIAMFGEKK